MVHTDPLRAAFFDPPQPSRRERRADRTRRKALSPVRILLSLLLVPVVATSLTVSIFIRTSPFEHQDAIRHLAALSGCEAAVKVGLARASIGEPGYHARNDADGDGIACNENDSVIGSLQASDLQEKTPVPAINTGGAKFVRP